MHVEQKSLNTKSVTFSVLTRLRRISVYGVSFQFLPLIAKTLIGPVLGGGVFSLAIWAISGFSISGLAFSIGWFALALCLGARYPSWTFVVTASLLYGAFYCALIGQFNLHAIVMIGLGLHCMYALTKPRCATIGCCNFHAYGPMGRGSLARKIHLARFELYASLLCAALCVAWLCAYIRGPGWALIGPVAHGGIRQISWLLRKSPQLRGNIFLRLRIQGSEALLIALAMHVLLIFAFNEKSN